MATGPNPSCGGWSTTARTPPSFRADYHRTLSELYEDNFLVPLAEWAHGHGVPLRVQSYGEPPATLSSYAHVDGIEGEQWGWTRMPPTKWASSAAQHLGVPIVSSETWTWVHAPSFRATPLDLLGEAHEHFLLGVNQLIGHGWPCSPRPEGPGGGLGWFFYASAALDDRNAWWPAAADLMAYLQRLSGLLRLGEPVRDVLLYLPTTDAYARLGTATSLDLWRTLAAMIDPRVIGLAAHRRLRPRPAGRRAGGPDRARRRPRRGAARSGHRARRDPNLAGHAWRQPAARCSPSTRTTTRRPWSVGTSHPI